MLKKVFIPVISVAAITAAAFSASTLAKPHHPMPMMQELNLTIAQKREIRGLMQSAREQRKSTTVTGKHMGISWLYLLQNAPLTDEQINQLMTDSADDVAAKRLHLALVRNQIWQLLDDEQRAIAQGFTPELPAREPRQPDFAFLDLTDIQQSEAEALSAQRESLKQQGIALNKAFIEQEKLLIQQDRLDEAAWQSLYQEYEPELTSLSIEIAQLQNAFFATLDDSQQRALVAKMMHRKKRKMGGKGEQQESGAKRRS